MDLREIVMKYLKDNKLDGLYNEDMCACKIDDLIPCDEPSSSCQSGKIKNCEACDNMHDRICKSDYDYCIEELK